MNRKNLFLPVTALLALVFAFVPSAGSGILGALALPFVAAGRVLRAMSLSGGIGNIAAIGLLTLLSGIPLVFWWRGKRRPEDWMLVLLAPVTALVLYYMVNPGLRSAAMQNEVGDMVYAASFWSTLAVWGILRLARSRETLEGNLYKALRIFLLLCAASCVFDCFGSNLAQLRWDLEHRLNADYGFGIQKGPTIFFLVLDYLAFALEDGLTALALWRGAALLEELGRDPFSAASIAAAARLSRRCRGNLVIIALAGLTQNLGQLLMADLLLNVHVAVRFPVMGMSVSFAVLAVTKLLVRGKELKDESDLFI